MNFLQRLLSTDEAAVDSVIVGGMAALLTLCGVSVYISIVDHASWNPINFGSACAAIIGAAGGVKVARERK